MSVVDKIQHYQRSIERCSGDEKRMMHCISKLYNLPVTVQHLQVTGVGRTVNALRKYDGDVGEASKALVAKWKSMVADEDSSEADEEDEGCEPDASDTYDDSAESPKHNKVINMDKKESSQKNQEARERHKNITNKSDSSKHSSKNASSENVKAKNNENKSPPTKSQENQEGKHDSKHAKDRHDSKHRSKSEEKSKSASNPKSDSDFKDKKYESKDKSKVKSEDSRKDIGKVSSSSSSGLNKQVVESNDDSRKRKVSSSSDRHFKKKRRSDEVENVDEIENQQSNSEEDDFTALPNVSQESESEEDVSNICIKQEPLSPSPKATNELHDHKSEDKNMKDKSKDNSGKSKSSKSKSTNEDVKKHENSKHKDKSSKSDDHRKSEKRKEECHSSTKESKSKNQPSSSSIESKSKSSEKHHNEKDEKSRSSKDANKSNTKELKEKKKVKQEINGDEGIDCYSGASFAEALGMCTKSLNVRKRNSSPVLVKTIKTEPGTSTVSSSRSPMKVKTKPTSSTDVSEPLSLLGPNVKLEPLSVDLASTLPEISPNYKPLPHITPVHRKQEEDTALTKVIYAKNQRTKVFSGNKTGYTIVPTLYELCIRVLIENIEALEFTGGVPFYILKPVLERATSDQLFMLEHHNPYLVEDTDALWQFHCNREFRNKQREEMETWREMYMRCLDEREAKLKALTANIKQSIDNSLPVRSTKLAYVDNVVKPPRNVLRKQAKYGTAKATPTSTSDLKNKLIMGGGNNAATNISVPPPPMSRIKTSTSTIVKKTKAPLMAKALQLIKGRYKR
ncbi:transcription elongation factor B polypeptide 3 [Orussus abietinus]|uniref:transcription elongation factor B polypeptide 3 n=1 Tax=Orussus abietinus TaxID=222816 RepID=UPI000625EE6B|nr:transcription elongation factor B polypeptide 3 [Orussus abietinus]XP_023288050.1 transcription elongation factor B polypeptide 3 [Orussus abietinus]